MPMFNLIKSLKFWSTVDRPWSHLRPLIKALRSPPYDLAALAALNEELTRNHTEMPESLLWRILDLAEKARATPGDVAAAPLLTEIWRGALWEVQTRNRAT